MKPAFSLMAALTLISGLSTASCVGLRSGISYPDYRSSDVRKQLESPENDQDPSISLGNFKIKDETCKDINTAMVSTVLSEDDLSRFLQSQNVKPVEVKARDNLFWYEFPGGDKSSRVRLRLAVLEDSKQADDELHKSLLEHGPGWWGLRRANLSILIPKATVGEAIAFALKYKLICWGMMAIADTDDVYVVPGPYMNL